MVLKHEESVGEDWGVEKIFFSKKASRRMNSHFYFSSLFFGETALLVLFPPPPLGALPSSLLDRLDPKVGQFFPFSLLLGEGKARGEVRSQ